MSHLVPDAYNRFVVQASTIIRIHDTARFARSTAETVFFHKIPTTRN